MSLQEVEAAEPGGGGGGSGGGGDDLCDWEDGGGLCTGEEGGEGGLQGSTLGSVGRCWWHKQGPNILVELTKRTFSQFT